MLAGVVAEAASAGVARLSGFLFCELIELCEEQPRAKMNKAVSVFFMRPHELKRIDQRQDIRWCNIEHSFDSCLTCNRGYVFNKLA